MAFDLFDGERERELALAQARRHLEAARAAHDEQGMQQALAGLERALERASSIPPPPDAVPESRRVPPSSRAMAFMRDNEDALVIGADARFFRLPHGEPVDLSRRRALRHILIALCNMREQAPGEALSIDALVESGWPGEKLLAESGAGRVYTAIATLRRMGLKAMLVRRDDGYLLDPTVALLRL